MIQKINGRRQWNCDSDGRVICMYECGRWLSFNKRKWLGFKASDKNSFVITVAKLLIKYLSIINIVQYPGTWLKFYYIDTGVLLENTPLLKFIRNCIRELSGVFSISSINLVPRAFPFQGERGWSSLVKISMTSFSAFHGCLCLGVVCLYNKYMLFAGREVRIGKNGARGLAYGPYAVSHRARAFDVSVK